MIYINLKNPKSIDSVAVKTEIKHLLEVGYKTNQILLNLNFVTSDKVINIILNKFKVVKNRIRFESEKY